MAKEPSDEIGRPCSLTKFDILFLDSDQSIDRVGETGAKAKQHDSP